MTKDKGKEIPKAGTPVPAPVRKRVELRIDPDQYERVKYWSERRGMSVNEYLAAALDLKVRHDNMDYDLPTLEQRRLNQLIDEMASMSRTTANLERVIISGFESLIGLARGDSTYLSDAEEGELDS